MKKFIASIMTCAMVFTSASFCFAESEAETAAAPAGIQADVDLTYSAMGQEASGKVTVQVDPENDAAVSGSLFIPGEEKEQNTVVSAEDLIRVVGGETYINVDCVKALAESITGDASFSSLLSMFGITESWLKIPKFDLYFNEEHMNSITDILNMASFEDIQAVGGQIGALFGPEETETSYIYTVDNERLIQAADLIDGVIENHKGQIVALASIMSPASALKAIDIDKSFGEYISAYASGRASVTGEDEAAISEEVIDSLPELVNSLVEAALDQANVPFEIPDLSGIADQIPDLSDLLASAIQEGGISVNGTLEVNKEGAPVDGKINVTANEESVDVIIHAEAQDDKNGTSVVQVLLNGEEKVSVETSVSAGDNSVVIEGVIKEDGAEAGRYMINAEQGEDGSLNATMNVQSIGQDETGVTYTDDVMSALLNVGPDEMGYHGTLVINAYGQEAFVGSFQATQTESGVEVAFAASVEGESVVDGNVIVSATNEYGYENEQTLKYNLTIKDYVLNGMLGATPEFEHFCFTCTALTGEEMVADFALVGALSKVEGLDIVAPEASSSIFDVISSVTAMYYSMMAMQSEAASEMASEIVTE